MVMNRTLTAAIPLMLLFAATAGPARAEAEPRAYFYHGLDYGTDSLIHPLRLVVNGGWGIMQLSSRDNHPLDVDYRQGWKNVWKNLADPGGAIQAEGWWDFLQREVIPISFNSGKAHYWPNYTQHLFGGGMSYRMITEWYRAHGYERASLWSGGTMMSYHLLNEVVENDAYDGWSTDPVADVLLFDPASIILFSHEGVCRFFGETLHMSDWSYQPLVDPWHETLLNNGQNFAMKLDLPFWERWSLFYHYGTHGELGLSRTWDDGRSLSFGAGMKADILIDITQYHKGAELAATAGVFYDRHNSLLASVLWACSKDYKLRVNFYPGLFDLCGLRPGLAFNLNRNDSFAMGVNLSSLGLPFGIAAGREPTYSR
jgi:hypothetical protein